MFNFDKTDLQRFAVSSLGALTLSAACVLGAVGPAKAAVPVNLAQWQSDVENRIATTHEADGVYQSSKLATSEVSVRFTADGDYAGAVLAKSSGDARLDERALTVARTIAYPALPASERGAPRTVRMKLFFGEGADAEARYDAVRSQKAHAVEVVNAAKGTELAAR